MLFRRLAWIGLAAAAVACGQTPNAPRGFDVPIPQAAAAMPPVIRSIAVPTSRREAATDVAITAVVEDADTPLADLNFIWSANVGAITSAGTTATWRHAPGLFKGLDVIITLTVVNQFLVKENGQLVVREFRVVSQAAPFRVHDSVAEQKELARRFLIDLFGNSSIPPLACLVDFSEVGRCAQGKQDELDDITNHRRDYRVLDRRIYSQFVVAIAPDRGEVHNDAEFIDVRINFENDPPVGYSARGDFWLTTLYDSGRWWLCESRFTPPGDSGIATIKRKRGASLIKK